MKRKIKVLGSDNCNISISALISEICMCYCSQKMLIRSQGKKIIVSENV